MTISMNGPDLDIAHNTSGVQMAECKCGEPIHKRIPNRRKPNITLKEFKREAYIKHQQHLTNIIERERLKIALSAKYGKTATYQETDSRSEIKPCVLNNPNGTHNYTTLNETTIYCTQCGDVQRIGGVSEEHANNMYQCYACANEAEYTVRLIEPTIMRDYHYCESDAKKFSIEFINEIPQSRVVISKI